MPFLSSIRRRPARGLRQAEAPQPLVQSIPAAADRVLVTWGDITVADDDDRFIPRGDAIYAYSLTGSEREWVLPPAFRGRNLEAFTLSREGRGPAPRYTAKDRAVLLALEPRTPVKIVVR